MLLVILAFSEPVELPYVGTVLDRDENSFYQVFEREDFVQASVYRENDTSYTVIVNIREGPAMVERIDQQGFDRIISTILEKGPIQDQEYLSRHPDPANTRVFIMPTAYTPAKGRGYFADYELIFLERAWGLSDRVMLSGGLTLYPVPLDYWFFYAGAKFKLAQWGKGSAAALGAHMIVPPVASWGQDYFIPVSLAYCVVSAQNKSLSGTVGAGVVSMGQTWFGGFGGIKAGPKKFRFMAEYWHALHRESTGLVNTNALVCGFRISGQRLSADIGLIYFDFPGWLRWSPVGVPLLNVSYKF